MASTPAQRSQAATVAAHDRWSRVHGDQARRDQLAPARAGRRRQFEQKAIDQAAKAGLVLTPQELDEAVTHLQRAHQARMTLASARARATDSPRGTP